MGKNRAGTRVRGVQAARAATRLKRRRGAIEEQSVFERGTRGIRSRPPANAARRTLCATLRHVRPGEGHQFGGQPRQLAGHASSLRPLERQATATTKNQNFPEGRVARSALRCESSLSRLRQRYESDGVILPYASTSIRSQWRSKRLDPRRRKNLGRVVDHALLHHQRYLPDRRDVARRIAVHQDQVGELAARD